MKRQISFLETDIAGKKWSDCKKTLILIAPGSLENACQWMRISLTLPLSKLNIHMKYYIYLILTLWVVFVKCLCFDFSENGLLTLADDRSVRYCTSSGQCKKFLGTEFGFCNFDHNISGFCERCDTILESCSGQGFLCESGLRECFLNCEGIQIC